MRVLYGKCFGIGNAVMAVPAIKAIRKLPHVSRLDVLIGTGPDDVGALNVMFELKKQGVIDVVHTNVAEGEFDVAIMAIPFDGRWRNGTHFRAERVIDGRPRPDPSTHGLVSWKKHEIAYQMDNVSEICRDIMYAEESSCFMDRPKTLENTLYLGLGYKKDQAGFWKTKHWGNENYSIFLKELFAIDDTVRVRTTGDMNDYHESIRPIMDMVKNKRFSYVPTPNITDAFREVGRSTMYFGNDTGMMHVAASFDMPTMGLFFLENSHVKCEPRCRKSMPVYDPKKLIDPLDMADKVKGALDRE